MFEEAGVPYTDVCRKAGSSSEALKYRKGEVPNVPPMFPPIVRRGDFVLNQTTAILHYLGKEFDLYPSGGPQEEAVALAWALTAADCIAEGHDCFHPVDKAGTYDSQKAEAAPQIKRFREVRMPSYLEKFEKQLSQNFGGVGFFVGDKVLSKCQESAPCIVAR